MKLMYDISDINNWKLVKESYREFQACKPGIGVQVLNKTNGATYCTSQKYPWVIMGMAGEVYVDSDDIQVEDQNGVNVTHKYAGQDKRFGWTKFRIVGGSHQDTLIGTQSKNCRQYYAFYINPNKYGEEAVRCFEWTSNNETCQGIIRSSDLRNSRYGIGNFLVCRAIGDSDRPNLNVIDFVQGDTFIQRFNAKPFNLKQIDKAIDAYNNDRQIEEAMTDKLIQSRQEMSNANSKNSRRDIRLFDDDVMFIRQLGKKLFNTQVLPYVQECKASEQNVEVTQAFNTGKYYVLKSEYSNTKDKADSTKVKVRVLIDDEIPQNIRAKYESIRLMFNIVCQNKNKQFKVNAIICDNYQNSKNLNKSSMVLTQRSDLAIIRADKEPKYIQHTKIFKGTDAGSDVCRMICSEAARGFKYMAI